MSLVSPAEANAPIPGENYTSDTRNYPWHRPPDITDIDEAIEYVSTNLVETNDGFRYMAMLGVGIPVSAVTDMIVTNGIGDGKFTTDFALLIAGPVARLVTVMAKSYGIEYEMGLETGEQIMTAEFIRGIAGDVDLTGQATSAVQEEASQIIEEEAEQTDDTPEGIMAPAPQDEQNAMLGFAAEEEEEQIDG